MSKIDLHIHSNCSDDAELSVEKIVSMSKKSDMKVIAITDHNSVRGVEKAIVCGNKLGVEVIPGIEIDCTFNSINLHVLGYYIDYNRREFHELEKQVYDQEMKFASEKIRRLRENTGLVVDEMEVLEKANGKIVTGELIAEILLSKSNSSDNELLRPYIMGGARSDMPYVNFYWDFFSQGKAAYVPVKYISLRDTIELIKSSNGIPVIAHPGNNLKEYMAVIDSIIKEGIEGIEVFSTYHSKEQTDYFYQKAIEYKLPMTCGSDFHGKNKPNITIGGCDCSLPYRDIVDPLKAKI